VVAASALKSSRSDPYVVVDIPGKKTTQKLKTRVVKNVCTFMSLPLFRFIRNSLFKQTGNPVWNEDFSMSGEPLESDDTIRFTVHSSDMVGSSLLGIAELEVDEIINSDDGMCPKVLTLLNAKGDEDKPQGDLHVLVAYGDAKLPEVQVTPRETSPRDELKKSGELSPRGGLFSKRRKSISSTDELSPRSADSKKSGEISPRESGGLFAVRRKKSIGHEGDELSPRSADGDSPRGDGSKRGAASTNDVDKLKTSNKKTKTKKNKSAGTVEKEK